jgi:hypothetical protein
LHVKKLKGGMPLANPSPLALKEHAENAGLGQALAATLVMSSLHSFRAPSVSLSHWLPKWRKGRSFDSG